MSILRRIRKNIYFWFFNKFLSRHIKVFSMQGYVDSSQMISYREHLKRIREELVAKLVIEFINKNHIVIEEEPSFNKTSVCVKVKIRVV